MSWQMIRNLKYWGLRLLDQLLPPRCLSCGTGVQSEVLAGGSNSGRICADCWQKLDFLQGPACLCCGYPFDFQVAASLCGTCQVQAPPYDRARAALRYDDGSRRMIISFKHGDRTDYVDFFGQLLVQAAQSLSLGHDKSGVIVVPVPLHKKRLGKRRYNQAALLAQAFAGKKNYDYCPDLLARAKHTPPQNGNFGRRKRNVSGVFRLRRGYDQMIRGRTIILIDDVYTTGATAGACAKTLKRAGAGRVEVVTLARVC